MPKNPKDKVSRRASLLERVPRDQEGMFLLHSTVVQPLTAEQLPKAGWSIFIRDRAGKWFRVCDPTMVVLGNLPRELEVVYGWVPEAAGGGYDQASLVEPFGGGDIVIPFYLEDGDRPIYDRLWVVLTSTKRPLHGGAVLDFIRRLPKAVAADAKAHVEPSTDEREAACDVLAEKADIAGPQCVQRVHLLGTAGPQVSFIQIAGLGKSGRKPGARYFGFELKHDQVARPSDGPRPTRRLLINAFPEADSDDQKLYESWVLCRWVDVDTTSGQTYTGLDMLTRWAVRRAHSLL